eukprot:scaffold23981_cov43-Phaeocystis_antarctica.AAC.1
MNTPPSPHASRITSRRGDATSLSSHLGAASCVKHRTAAQSSSPQPRASGSAGEISAPPELEASTATRSTSPELTPSVDGVAAGPTSSSPACDAASPAPRSHADILRAHPRGSAV